MNNARRDLTAVIDQGVASLGAFLVSAIFIRVCGLEEFGLVSLVWLVLLFATAIQHAVLTSPAQVLVPKLVATTGARYRAWLVRIHFVSLALLLGTLYGVWYLADLALLPRELGLGVPLCFLLARLTFTFTRYQAFMGPAGARRVLPLDLLHSTLSVGGLLFLAHTRSLDAESGLLTLGAASMISGAVGLVSLQRIGWAWGPVGQETTSRHWEISRWLVGRAIAQWFTSNSFLAALGALQGPAALGGVRAAQTLVGLAGVVLQAFENVFPISAARAADEGGGAGLATLVRERGSRWLAGLLACLMPLVAMPDLFLEILAVDQGPELHTSLYFFAAGAVLALAIMLCGACLRATERLAPLLVAQAVAGALGAALAGPITSRFGIIGCLVGIVGQQVVILAILSPPTWAALRGGRRMASIEP